MRWCGGVLALESRGLDPSNREVRISMMLAREHERVSVMIEELRALQAELMGQGTEPEDRRRQIAEHIRQHLLADLSAAAKANLIEQLRELLAGPEDVAVGVPGGLGGAGGAASPPPPQANKFDAPTLCGMLIDAISSAPPDVAEGLGKRLIRELNLKQFMAAPSAPAAVPAAASSGSKGDGAFETKVREALGLGPSDPLDPGRVGRYVSFVNEQLVDRARSALFTPEAQVLQDALRRPPRMPSMSRLLKEYLAGNKPSGDVRGADLEAEVRRIGIAIDASITGVERGLDITCKWLVAEMHPAVVERRGLAQRLGPADLWKQLKASWERRQITSAEDLRMALEQTLRDEVAEVAKESINLIGS